jgi:hypothetical protein
MVIKNIFLNCLWKFNFGIRSEAWMAAEVKEIFSDYQPCHMVEMTDVSGTTTSVQIIRVCCGIGSEPSHLYANP